MKHRKKAAGIQLESGSHDDEMFMDEEDFLSADFMTPSPPSAAGLFASANDSDNAIRKRRSLHEGAHHSVGSHVIYKRATLQSESDYGESSTFIVLL